MTTSVIEQLLDEQRGAGDEVAVGVEHHAAAVEHQLVLPAHLVHVGERAAGVGGTGGEHALAGAVLAGVVRRAVDVDVQLGAAGGLLGERAGGAPHVLADADAHLHAADHVQLVGVAVGAGREVAGLVEHGVVRQQPLAVGADAPRRRRTPPRRCRGRGRRRRSRPPPRSGRVRAATSLERGQVVGDEARLQHEVFGRVAGDRQLGERDDVAPGASAWS